jgi:hypothetical protein
MPSLLRDESVAVDVCVFDQRSSDAHSAECLPGVDVVELRACVDNESEQARLIDRVARDDGRRLAKDALEKAVHLRVVVDAIGVPRSGTAQVERASP